MLHVAFLGVGQAAFHHAQVVLQLGHKPVVAANRDPNSPRLRRFLELVPRIRLDTVNNILSDGSVDAIISCLSWDENSKILPKLLGTPRPVLIEKPPSLEANLLERALRETSFASNKVVAYNRRSYETTNHLKKRLKDGGLKGIEVTISEELQHHVNRHGEAILPHLMAFSSSHALDLILYLFGIPRIQKVYRHCKGQFTSCHALMETPSGVPIWLSLNADDPSPAGIRCRFEDGTAWHLAPLETLSVYQGHEVLPPTNEIPFRRYKPQLRQQYFVDPSFKPGFLAQMKTFLEGSYSALPSLDESVELLRLIEQLRG